MAKVKKDKVEEELDKLGEESAMHSTCREYQCPCHDKLKVATKFLESLVECFPGTSVGNSAKGILEEVSK